MLVIAAPGQGAQAPGFLAPWLELPGVRDRIGAWSDLAGCDLIACGTTAGADEIKDTAVAQPLLVAAGIAAAEVLFGDLEQAQRQAGILAGHSVGELPAGAIAGVLTPEQAISLVRVRSHAMAQAAALVPTGMTAVLGGDEAAVLDAIEAHGLTPANINGAGQVVAAGTLAQLDAFAADPPARARLIPLSVAGAFHTRHMAPAVESLRAAAGDLTAAEPAVSYLLAFVPADLKNDGKFHTVNIKMLTKEKYTVQARRGFFAPKHGKTPDELAKQDIEDAVFSQEEQQGLPVQLNLQYFKVDDVNAKLAVLTHVDLNQIRFDRADDRNSDNLTIVAALFDRNGNFIKADQKTLEMHLKDATLEKLHRSGLTVKTNFDVKPGGYMVRLVVRDSKDAQIASRNGVVDIP